MYILGASNRIKALQVERMRMKKRLQHKIKDTLYFVGVSAKASTHSLVLKWCVLHGCCCLLLQNIHILEVARATARGERDRVCPREPNAQRHERDMGGGS